MPYITSADEHWVLFFIVVRSPKSTKDKFSSLFDWFNIDLKTDFRLWWNLYYQAIRFRIIGSRADSFASQKLHQYEE